MKIPKFFLIFLITLTPILFFPFSYEFPKWLFIYLLLFLFCIFEPLTKEQKDKYLFNFKEPLFITFSLYLFFSIFSLRNAINFDFAFFSFSNLLLIFFFLFIPNFSKEEFKKLISFFLIPSLIVGIYGFLQSIGIDFLKLPLKFKYLPISTIGNKNFAAEYQLIVLPILIYNLFFSGKKIWTFISSLSLSFSFVHLLLTETKAAYISFILGCLLLIYFTKNIKQLKKIKNFSFFLIFIIILFLGNKFLNYKKYYLQENGKNLQKNGKINVSEFNTLKIRFLIWKAGKNAFLKSPITGVGIGNFNIVLRPFYPEELLKEFVGKVEAGTAHNEFLSVLVETGVFGFISFLGFIFFVIFLGIKKAKNSLKEEKPLELFLFLSLFVILIDSFASSPLHQPTTLFIFSLFTGFLFYEREYKLYQKKIFYIFSFVFFFSFYFFGLKPVLGSYYFNKAEKFFSQGKIPSCFYYGEKAIFFQPRNKDILMNLGNMYLSTGNLKMAEILYKRVIIYFPYEPGGYSNIGIVLTHQNKFQQAEKYYKISLSMDPYQAEVYNNLGILYIKQKRYKEAKECFLKAISMDIEKDYFQYSYKNLEMLNSR